MILILMGVSGCGKTEVARKLSSHLSWQFIEGDDLHPPENIRKMTHGTPLSDADREPWLSEIHTQMLKFENAVVSCSALKQTYRKILMGDIAPSNSVVFVFLKVSTSVLEERLQSRSDHFMPVTLLESQLSILEEPSEDECNSVIVDANGAVDQVVNFILRDVKIG